MKKKQGFTLIELMVVVAIVGIIAAIALPSYQSSVRKGHRGDVQSYMMELAQKEQQYFIDNRSFTSTASNLGYSSAPGTISKYYTVTISAPATTPPTFTITATAIGTQVADGNLTLDNTGVKTPSSYW